MYHTVDWRSSSASSPTVSWFWSLSGQKPYWSMAVSIADPSSMGSGRMYSSSSCVIAAGTASKRSY